MNVDKLGYFARSGGVPLYLGDEPLVALAIRTAVEEALKPVIGEARGVPSGAYDSGRCVAWTCESPRLVHERARVAFVTRGGGFIA